MAATQAVVSSGKKTSRDAVAPAAEETPPLFPELEAQTSARDGGAARAEPDAPAPGGVHRPPGDPSHREAIRPAGRGREGDPEGGLNGEGRSEGAITLKRLAAELAERRGVDKKQAEAITADLVELIAGHLKAGARLRLAGLGVLEPKRFAARTGRNPATGETMQIPASTKIVFRAAKELRQAA